jgi:hypothetical protein
MSAATIIATVEADASNVLATGLSRLTALETAFAAAGPEFAKLLTDATAGVGTVLAAGASVAAAATNPAAAAVAVRAAIVPVTNAFVSAFNTIEGFVEGVEGKTPAAGASSAEVDGAAAGSGVRNLVDAFFDDISGAGAPAAAAPAAAPAAPAS